VEAHIKPQSAKNKGRTLQKEICRDLLEIGKEHGLEPDDVLSRSMGAAGVDVILSPAARKIFPFSIEAKNVEALNVVKVFVEHFNKYVKEPTLKLLIHRRNRTEPMVTLRWQDFLEIWRRSIVKAGKQD
jgi:hypothetical protein